MNDINLQIARKNTSSIKSCSSRLIYYSTIYAHLYPNAPGKICISNNRFKKTIISSDSPSARVSNNQRISQIVNFAKGRKTQYGNFYLGEPLNVNSLGRMQGMPGGSGTPPLNKFN